MSAPSSSGLSVELLLRVIDVVWKPSPTPVVNVINHPPTAVI